MVVAHNLSTAVRPTFRRSPTGRRPAFHNSDAALTVEAPDSRAGAAISSLGSRFLGDATIGEACDQWRGMSALLHLVFKKSQTQNPRSGNGATQTRSAALRNSAY